jgi:hypothetical protein
MKTIKTLAAATLSLLLFFSCRKEIGTSETKAVTNSSSTKIRWSDLPPEYKNAVQIPENNNTLFTERSSNTIVYSFGPYGMANVTNPKFSLYPPVNGSVISAIGLSEHTSAHYLNNITIWYKQPDGTTVKRWAGVELSQNDLLAFRQLTTNEYINGFHLTSSAGGISSLSLITNKASISAGVEDGIPSSGSTGPGTWILSMKGYALTSIQQITINTYCKPWEKIAGSDGRDIAVASDGTAFMTNSVGKIYRMNSGTNTWIQMTGSDGKSIAANSGKVWMVNTVGNIYQLINNSWLQMPGSDANDIAINSDGRIWMVNSAGKIYRYNASTSTWQLMPGSSASRIAAGNGQVWMVNSVGNIYKWNGASWTQTNGSDGRDIAISNDGNVWLTNTSGLIYKAENGGNNWFELAGSDGSTISANNN